MKYALSIESVLSGMDYEERIQRALDTGFNAVEVWGVDEAKKKLLLEAKKRGVHTAFMVGINGFVTPDAEKRKNAMDTLKCNLDVARELDCPNICLLVGAREPLIYDHARANVLDFLAKAADELKDSGVVGVVESLCPHSHPDVFATSMRDVIAWMRELKRPEIQLQFDLYHTAMTDPDLESLVRDNIDITAYYQAADAPGRGQPGTGVLRFDRLLRIIKDGGFDGYFAWEYIPQGDAMESIIQTKKLHV